MYSAITARMTNVFAFGKLLTNREMEYGQNETICDFSLYFTINWVATGARNVPIGYTFCFFAANNV